MKANDESMVSLRSRLFDGLSKTFTLLWHLLTSSTEYIKADVSSVTSVGTLVVLGR